MMVRLPNAATVVGFDLTHAVDQYLGSKMTLQTAAELEV
jgi:hypothetical protein